MPLPGPEPSIGLHHDQGQAGHLAYQVFLWWTDVLFGPIFPSFPITDQQSFSFIICGWPSHINTSV